MFQKTLLSVLLRPQGLHQLTPTTCRVLNKNPQLSYYRCFSVKKEKEKGDKFHPFVENDDNFFRFGIKEDKKEDSFEFLKESNENGKVLEKEKKSNSNVKRDEPKKERQHQEVQKKPKLTSTPFYNLLKQSCKMNDWKNGLGIWNEVKQKHDTLSIDNINSFLYLCAEGNTTQYLPDILNYINENKLQPGIQTYSLLIRIYAQANLFEEAEKSLEDLKKIGNPTRRSFEPFITEKVKRGLVIEAFDYFQLALKTIDNIDPSIYETLIRGLIDMRKNEPVDKKYILMVFKEMRRASFILDSTLEKTVSEWFQRFLFIEHFLIFFSFFFLEKKIMIIIIAIQR